MKKKEYVLSDLVCKRPTSWLIIVLTAIFANALPLWLLWCVVGLLLVELNERRA